MYKIKLLCVFGLLFSQVMIAQLKTVTGVITDESGAPLPGATVVNLNTSNGVSSDFDGNFSIESSVGETITISYVGYTDQTIQIGEENSYNILLVSNNKLDEVVVTSLGITRDKKSLGYAVQELSGEDFQDVKALNPIESLSGEIAGLDIQSYNTMGGSANVIVRGYSSLTGSNQALFVIDGTPISNSTPNTGNMKSGGGGFDYGNAAMDINPEDVASVSVLKGAAATALYGSRAANGVILITTKKGSKKSGLGVTINSQILFGSVDKSTYPEYQYEYGQGYGGQTDGGDGYWLSKWNGSSAVNTTDDASFGPKLNGKMVYKSYNMIPELTALYGKLSPDNPGEPAGAPLSFFNTQVIATNSVSIENADENGSFRLNYSNTNISGILPNSSIDRNAITFSGSRKLSDNFTTSANITYTKTDAVGRYGTGYDGRNVNQGFRQWYGTTVDLEMEKYVYEQTGKNYSWNMFGMDTSGTDPNTKNHYFNNPYWMRDKMANSDTRNRYFGNVTLDYKINDDLKVLGRLGFDQFDFTKEERIDVGAVDPAEYYASHRTVSERNFDLIVSYTKSITDKINIDANIGGNLRVNQWDYMTAQTNGGLNIPGLFALNNSSGPITSGDVSNYDATKKVDGVFARVSAGFDETYYIETTFRSDRSSSLPINNNRFNYSSISGSAIISNLIDNSNIDFAKVRANYAEVGADTSPYNVFSSYNLVAGFGGQPLATNPSTFNNPNLKAESTKETEIGLELDLFNRRVGLDFSYYNRTTEDLITPLEVSKATGGSALFVNAGAIENKGFEMVLNLNPYRSADFNWDITANWSTYTSKVTDLGQDSNGTDIEYLALGSFQGGVSLGAKKGEEYGILRGRNFIYHENGQKLKRSNGAYQRTTSNTEVLGSIIPDWTGGVKNSFNYKDINLSFLIDIQKGGDVFSLDQRYASLTGILKESARLNDKGNLIREAVADGGGVNMPGVNEDGSINNVYGEANSYLTVEGYVYMPEAAFVYDASFVKLREIKLGYKLNDNLINSTPFESASISIVGRNLWIISSNVPYSDPEAGISAGNVQGNQSGAYPSIKEIGVSLNLQF